MHFASAPPSSPPGSSLGRAWQRSIPAGTSQLSGERLIFQATSEQLLQALLGAWDGAVLFAASQRHTV